MPSIGTSRQQNATPGRHGGQPAVRARDADDAPDRVPGLDALAQRGSPAAQDAALGRTDRERPLARREHCVIDAHAALVSRDAPLGDVFFRTRLRPLRADLLPRSWQSETRAGVECSFACRSMPRWPPWAKRARPAVRRHGPPHRRRDRDRHAVPGVSGAIVADRRASSAPPGVLDLAALDHVANRHLGLSRGRGLDPRHRLDDLRSSRGGRPIGSTSTASAAASARRSRCQRPRLRAGGLASSGCLGTRRRRAAAGAASTGRSAARRAAARRRRLRPLPEPPAAAFGRVRRGLLPRPSSLSALAMPSDAHPSCSPPCRTSASATRS